MFGLFGLSLNKKKEGATYPLFFTSNLLKVAKKIP